MADPLDVLTLAEGRTAINDASSSVDATELAQYITAVSAVMDAEAGCIVQRTVTDEIHDGGGYALVTRLWPVTSATVTLTDDLAGTPTVLTAYRKEPFDRIPSLFSGRLELDTTTFTEGRWNVKVSYTAGRYASTAAVAPRFKVVAGSILRRLWKRESGTWAQSAEFFENFDTQAATSGFYRVAKPIIDELLSDELERYSKRAERRFGVA